MRTWYRTASLVAALALVASACAGAATPAPPTTAPATAAAPTSAPPTAAGPTTAPATTAPESEAPESEAPESEAPETSAPASEVPGSQTPAASVTPAPTTAHAGVESVPPGVTLVRWFCCLGAGDDPSQYKVESKVVEDFNATHDDIKLALELTPYLGARDALSTEIGAGNPPDIVGPVGIGGANAFGDEWLDLAPLIAKNNYDMTQFLPGSAEVFQVGDTQVGIPFAIYPSLMFFQRDMFDEIGLAYPPTKYGEKYTMPDGTQVDWTYDTVAQLAKMLTVDSNGKDATEEGFDPTKITQWGFEPQRDDLRGLAASWMAGQFVGPDGKVQIPEAWAAAWKWFYNAIWTDKTTMDSSTYNRPEIAGGSGNAFCSGKVALDLNFLWSTYCLGDAGNNWGTAVLPSYNGQTTAAFNADTFRIMKDTKNPDAAFTVLQYLLDDASSKLLRIYGGMPARPEKQDAFFEGLSTGFETSDGKPVTLLQPPDWQVAIDGVQFADSPNFEAPMPNYNESLDILTKYQQKWTGQSGLDMDQEIQTLKSELQAAWDK